MTYVSVNLSVADLKRPPLACHSHTLKISLNFMHFLGNFSQNYIITSVVGSAPPSTRNPHSTSVDVLFITGRNEVLAKVMFLQASVILSTGGGEGMVPGGVSPILGGSPIFRGEVSPILLGGRGGRCVSNFREGGVSNFPGGLQFFLGGVGV